MEELETTTNGNGAEAPTTKIVKKDVNKKLIAAGVATGVFIIGGFLLYRFAKGLGDMFADLDEEGLSNCALWG